MEAAGNLKPAVSEPDCDGAFRQSCADLRRLERRDWWMWATAVAVMLLLTAAVICLTFPRVLMAEDLNYQEQLDIAGRALLGLVLLFSVSIIYQQLRINRLRRSLSAHIGMTAALQTRAEVFEKLTILDPLTGLYNRRFAAEHLPIEMARAERQGYSLVVLMLDLNSLKRINDQLGHAAGDLVLREFARHLKRSIRSSDLPVRMGGDEFVVLLPECSPGGVVQALARLAGVDVQFRGQKIPVTFAAGWTDYQPGETADQLLERADQALYEDKRTRATEEHVREARAQRRQKQKMEVMGRLAGGVAHDFNNLLTIIRGYSEMLLECEHDQELREKVEEIHKAAERAASLTRQLLAFSRKQVVEIKLLDFNAVLADMQLMLEKLIGEKVHLVVEAAPELGMVRADPGQIEQIIMNLAVNARDAMPKGGTLSIHVQNFEMDADYVGVHPGARAGSYVMLSVRDTGVGMDAETRSHIFEPFFTTKEKGKGTGLGLSIVYGIVKQNAGYIWVESEPGHGTSLTIYFPRTKPEVEVAAEPSKAAAPALAKTQDAHAAATVLVVENVDALRHLICDYLRLEGYGVLEAATGDQAIQVAAEFPGRIVLLITDIVLSGMSGIELADCLMAQGSVLKVLYISGYNDYSFLYQEALRGRAAFLQTPFTPADFSRRLRELLETKLDEAQEPVTARA